MCRLKNFLPTRDLRILYNSMILPHLQYSILSWGFKPGSLDKLQKRAVRIISNSKYNSHTDPIFKKLNLLTLKYIFELNVLKLFYKYKNNILPFYVSHMFSDYSVPHSYPLRATYVLNAPGSNTPSGEKCIRHYLRSVVNELKPDILDKVSTHSLQGYAFYIKKITITEYKMECVKRNCYVCNCCLIIPFHLCMYLHVFFFVFLLRYPIYNYLYICSFCLSSFCNKCIFPFAEEWGISDFRYNSF